MSAGTGAGAGAGAGAGSPQTTAFIGISGWRYPPWRGTFYPKGLVQAHELEYASERLGSIEVNGSFYSLQRPSSFLHWKEQTPADFVFSVKGGRYITHLLKLKNVHSALANFFASGVLALEEKLGPILWQLPEKVTFDAEILEAFLAQLPATTDEALTLAADRDERMEGRSWVEARPARPLRHALEVRHPSFEVAECHEILSRHNVAMVIADSAGRWPMLRDVVTSDFVYARLHGADELYVSGYTDDALDRWAGDVGGWLSGGGSPDGRARDVYVYFDNDAKVRSPFDAMGLQQRVSARGFSAGGFSTGGFSAGPG